MTLPAGVGPMVPCRGCNAAIRFVGTSAGKSMPVDALAERLWLAPVPEGVAVLTVATLLDADGVIHRGVPDGPGAVLVEGYRPHFATCPNAPDFRRSRASSTPRRTDAKGDPR